MLSQKQTERGKRRSQRFVSCKQQQQHLILEFFQFQLLTVLIASPEQYPQSIVALIALLSPLPNQRLQPVEQLLAFAQISGQATYEKALSALSR